MLRSETVKYDATRSVSHYESVGRGFESLSAYHLKSLKLLSFRLFSYFLTEFEIVELKIWVFWGSHPEKLVIQQLCQRGKWHLQFALQIVYLPVESGGNRCFG